MKVTKKMNKDKTVNTVEIEIYGEWYEIRKSTCKGRIEIRTKGTTVMTPIVSNVVGIGSQEGFKKKN